MSHINFGQYNPRSFKEEAENFQMLTHDDGRRRIAKGHLSDSGDLNN